MFQASRKKFLEYTMSGWSSLQSGFDKKNLVTVTASLTLPVVPREHQFLSFLTEKKEFMKSFLFVT